MHKLLFLLLGLSFGIHQFHISQCTIQFLEDERKLDIKMHLFLDDLELALDKQGHSHLHIGRKEENHHSDSLILSYIQQHFSIQFDGQLGELSFISKEITKDGKAIWCHLEIQNVSNSRQITIQNRVLMDIFEDQKNIVKFIGLEGKKSFLFEKGTESKSIHP